MPAFDSPGLAVSSPIPEGAEHSSDARDTLRRADEFAFLLDLDHDSLAERAHERPLVENLKTLRSAQGLARDLRALADEVDVARSALREAIATGLEQHDRGTVEFEQSDSPRRIPASASRGGIRG